MKTNLTNILNKPFPSEQPLESLGPYEAHQHIFDEPCEQAIKAALGAERPLLVCGEPGTGKSQLARAAAAVLNRPLVSHVVTSRTEPQDLLWRYDAVARLADAQVVRYASQDDGDTPALNVEDTNDPTAEEIETEPSKRQPLHPLNYTAPGPLWWVFDWEDADSQRKDSKISCLPPQPPKGWTREEGVVALIDEIDKADLDLPNALLECLGNGQFKIPHRRTPVSCNPEHAIPLVIITTNRERQLPPAFVRRCLVLELALPKERQKLIRWLVERGNGHFADRCSPEIIAEVAAEVADRRPEQAVDEFPQPGLAEYLDLLRVLANHAPGDPDKQRSVLKKLSRFVYEKRAAYEI